MEWQWQQQWSRRSHIPISVVRAPSIEAFNDVQVVLLRVSISHTPAHKTVEFSLLPAVIIIDVKIGIIENKIK